MFRTANKANFLARLPRAQRPIQLRPPLPPVLLRLSHPRLFLPQLFTASYATKINGPPHEPSNSTRQHELDTARQKLKPSPPDQVTSKSTTSAATYQSPQQRKTGPSVAEDMASELHAVRDAFALSSIPREVNVLGLAGTLPYLATSLTTLFLSWNVNTKWQADAAVSNSLLLEHDSAQYLLDLLEPIQIGYGAVIISFLGAIHWGMEWSERSPSRERARARYAIGVLAPAVAWPTILMPAPAALTTQFLAFTTLYFVDGRMTERGWAPSWYAPYRFVLTLVVGVAIFASLVGRARIGERKKGLIGAGFEERLKPKPGGEGRNWEKEEREEIKRRREKKREESKEATAESKEKGKESGAESNENGKESKEKGEESKGKGEESKGKGEESKGKGEESKGKGEESKGKGKESKETVKKEPGEEAKEGANEGKDKEGADARGKDEPKEQQEKGQEKRREKGQKRDQKEEGKKE